MLVSDPALVPLWLLESRCVVVRPVKQIFSVHFYVGVHLCVVSRVKAPLLFLSKLFFASGCLCKVLKPRLLPRTFSHSISLNAFGNTVTETPQFWFSRWDSWDSRHLSRFSKIIQWVRAGWRKNQISASPEPRALVLGDIFSSIIKSKSSQHLFDKRGNHRVWLCLFFPFKQKVGGQ